jgi:hypothetical protein
LLRNRRRRAHRRGLESDDEAPNHKRLSIAQQMGEIKQQLLILFTELSHDCQ